MRAKSFRRGTEKDRKRSCENHQKPYVSRFCDSSEAQIEKNFSALRAEITLFRTTLNLLLLLLCVCLWSRRDNSISKNPRCLVHDSLNCTPPKPRLDTIHRAASETSILTIQVLHIARKVLTLYWCARLFNFVKLVTRINWRFLVLLLSCATWHAFVLLIRCY